MIQLEHKALLQAGVHFGHLTRKRHPKMAPFIFMKQNGIHIIDLNKTITCMEEAALHLHAMARAGKKILFVATKRQAKASVESAAKHLGMPYVTERWLGGTLTNFITIRKLLKRMSTLEKNMHAAAYKRLAKKEQLIIAREQEKLHRILQGLTNVTRLPSALFVVDINREHIAVKEAKKLGIPVFAIADTNTNPEAVDFAIPGNDDAFRSIDIVVRYFTDTIQAGLEAYKKEKMEVTAQKETESSADVAAETAPKRGIKVVQGVVIKKGTSAKVKPIGEEASVKAAKNNAPTAGTNGSTTAVPKQLSGEQGEGQAEAKVKPIGEEASVKATKNNAPTAGTNGSTTAVPKQLSGEQGEGQAENTTVTS